ncbi:MAG TPA: TerC family protein [Stellaceae bacterium]|nr:TerC family protein [Stellaceae bacterium]
MSIGFGLDDLWALASVMMIDLVLAGDNALVVGMAASGLEARQRRRAIIWGIGIATALRIGFAGAALHLLEIIGLTLAGGILLLWVAWKLFREIYAVRRSHGAAGASGGAVHKTLLQACLQIALADVSMSLDNVLAVAGAARGSFPVLAAGLLVSVALMGVASNYLARLLARHPWISWVGLVMVTFVALRMIYDGSMEVATHSRLGLG